MNKESILANTDGLSAQQLADFIIKDIVTLEELKNTDLLDRTKRVAITKLIEAGILKQQKEQETRAKVDDDAWEEVRYTNKEITLIDWINNNPDNKHLQEAKGRVNFLQEERARIRNQKHGVLDNIRRNSNTYRPEEIKDFLSNGTLTEQDLYDCGIPKSALDNLSNIKAPKLQIGDTPKAIPNGYTEVYFWGYTGSGKTCALAATLKTADKKGYLNIATGSGYHYANQLKNIFTDNGKANDFLPAPTPSEKTQYLPFTLQKPKERGTRSVSLIELSGEIFKIFYAQNANLEFQSGEHENTFNSLNGFLNNNNRKIHFFFIDYDNKNTTNSTEGLKQSDFLAASATYFQNKKIFKKTTDAIYVVLTKSDLLLDENGNMVPKEKRVHYAKQYLNQHYSSFINTLKNICSTNSINGGKITVEPFSLGKVYFREICDFDGTTASNIVDILMDRIPRKKKSFLDVFNK